MKKYLVTGILIWVPILISLLFIRVIFRFSDNALLMLPSAYRPDVLLGVHIPGLGLIFVFLLLWITGLLFRNMFGKFIVSVWEVVVTHIPLVSSIHNGVKQALKVIFTTNKSFQEVVLVEYPRRDCWSVAFVTNRQQAHGVFKHDTLTLFIPTTPNPTSGYVFVVDETDVHYLDMPVDEAVKFIISLGTVDGIGDKIRRKKKGEKS
ncbi:MAG: DUF502 domain-containing protein [Pseudomonadota bacterium]|nr:DUF502 domain-containing protein [Pseudomonadota bacterium]